MLLMTLLAGITNTVGIANIRYWDVRLFRVIVVLYKKIMSKFAADALHNAIEENESKQL